MVSTVAQITTWVCRFACLAVLVAAIYPDYLDAQLAIFWPWLKAQSWFQHKMFEAYLSSAAFTFWMTLFGALIARLPFVRKIEGSKPDFKGYGKRIRWYIINFGLYNGLIYLWHMRVAKIPPDRFGEITYRVLLVELVTGIFLYDLIFYPIHVAFHKGPLFMRKMHATHHDGYERKPLTVDTVIHHHFVDGFLQVFVNVLVQQYTPFGPWRSKHLVSRMFHNIVVTYLLCEAHSGFDLPFMSHRVFPWLFGGSPRHNHHHHDGRIYYHQFFKYLDDYFGFVDGVANKKGAALDKAGERVKEKGA